jgi:uncharacterized repeat protein (TIGR03803 family)
MREYHLNTFRESRGESAGAESHRKRRVQPRCIVNLTDVESRVSGSLFLGKGDIKRRQRAARCNPGEGSASCARPVWLPPDSFWQFRVLHFFHEKSDGEVTLCDLIRGGDGSLYGTTYLGGAGSAGTVFELTP